MSVRGLHRVVSEYAHDTTSNSNIRVYIRARPCEDGSVPGDFLAVSGDESRRINIKDPDESSRKYGEVAFDFDKVFWTETKQDEVFDVICKPQVDHVIQGFNCCCFAYGQTGSGKTYSMFGNDSEIRGVIPRSAEYLFQALQKRTSTNEVGVVCSFLEIYNDSIRDLGKAHLVSIGAETTTSSAIFNKTSDIYESLAGKRGNPYFAPAFLSNSTPAKPSGNDDAAECVRGLGYKEVQDEYQTMNYEIHEDSEGNVFVGNLSMVPVTTIDEVMAMIGTGLKLRATHETKMNANSSRSHTVFTFHVLQRDKLTDTTISGTLNLIDLAGSERLKKSESVGMRLKEALHINTSLSALGKVIMSLDPSSDSTHIPYRDCKLTRVLQNSLGGNSYTIVLAAIHPHPTYYEECLSTLQFANRCRNVKNHPKVNYVDDPADKDSRIKRLQEELGAMRIKLAAAEKGGNSGVVTLAAGRGGKMSPGKLVELLKKLGIVASLTSDGALMVNGERHEMGKLGLDRDDNDEDEHGTGDAEDGGFGALYGHGKMTKMKLKLMVMELNEANQVHSNKSKERKALMQEQGKQIEDYSRKVSRLQLAVKHHEVAIQQLQEREELRRQEDLRAAEDVHRKEMDKLIVQYESAHKKALEVFDKAPSTFKTYTNALKTQDLAKHNFEEPLREEFRGQLKLMQDTADKELSNVKKQYEYWLKEKEVALEAFTERFNVYRAKKTEQLKMCEGEIIKMFEYMTVTDDILDGVERGVYRVERYQGKRGAATTGHAQTAVSFHATATGATARATTASGRRTNDIPNAAGLMAHVDPNAGDDDEAAIAGGKGRVLFPKGLRPRNPLKSGADDMKLAKKIVEQYVQRKDKLEETKKWVAKKNSVFATALLGTTAAAGGTGSGAGAGAGGGNNNSDDVDPYVEQHLRQLLGRVGGPQPPAETKQDAATGGAGGVVCVGGGGGGRGRSISRTNVLPGALARPSTGSGTVGRRNSSDLLGGGVPGDRRTSLSQVDSHSHIDSHASGHSSGMRRADRTPAAVHDALTHSPHSPQSDQLSAGGSRSRSRSRSRSPGSGRAGQGPSGRYKSFVGTSNSLHSTFSGSVNEEMASEEVKSLKAELVELKAQIKVDQQLIAGISSNEMVQYIMQLEEQNAELHKKVQEAHSSLHANRVAGVMTMDRKTLTTTTGMASTNGR